MSDTQIKSPLISDELMKRLAALETGLLQFNKDLSSKFEPLIIPGEIKQLPSVNQPPQPPPAPYPPLFDGMRKFISSIETEMDKAQRMLDTIKL